MITSRPHIARIHVPRRLPTPVRAFTPVTQVLLDQTYLIGKGVTLFVGFYCGLQWLYYRDMIKRAEEDKTKKNEKQKK